MSVRQYVDSMVQDCAAEIIGILGDIGPLGYYDLRRALRMEKHVAQAIIDRALNTLVETGKVQHRAYTADNSNKLQGKFHLREAAHG